MCKIDTDPESGICILKYTWFFYAACIIIITGNSCRK